MMHISCHESDLFCLPSLLLVASLCIICVTIISLLLLCASCLYTDLNTSQSVISNIATPVKSVTVKIGSGCERKKNKILIRNEQQNISYETVAEDNTQIGWVHNHPHGVVEHCVCLLQLFWALRH